MCGARKWNFTLTADQVKQLPVLDDMVRCCSSSSSSVQLPSHIDSYAIDRYCSGRPPDADEETCRALDFCGVDLTEAFSGNPSVRCAAEIALRNGPLWRDTGISGMGVSCEFVPYATTNGQEEILVWPSDKCVSDALSANMLCSAYPIVTRETEYELDLRNRVLTNYGKMLLRTQMTCVHEWFGRCADPSHFQTDPPCNHPMFKRTPK